MPDREAARHDWLDIGMVDIFDVSESDAAQLWSLDLIKERVHWKQLYKYRFHIDIDGNANSYAGLFLKLLSGGVVLKVASPNHYTRGISSAETLEKFRPGPIRSK